MTFTRARCGFVGTALFNAWLRALGTKVGRQAWIGEVSERVKMVY